MLSIEKLIFQSNYEWVLFLLETGKKISLVRELEIEGKIDCTGFIAHPVFFQSESFGPLHLTCSPQCRHHFLVHQSYIK